MHCSTLTRAARLSGFSLQSMYAQYGYTVRGVWLGGRVVRMLDLRSTGTVRGFESWPAGLPAVGCNPVGCQHACASVTKQYNLVPAKGR